MWRLNTRRSTLSHHPAKHPYASGQSCTTRSSPYDFVELGEPSVAVFELDLSRMMNKPQDVTAEPRNGRSASAGGMAGWADSFAP
jgi:hypothetical protein